MSPASRATGRERHEPGGLVGSGMATAGGNCDLVRGAHFRCRAKIVFAGTVRVEYATPST